MKKDEHARKRKELTKRKIQEEKTAALNRLVSLHLFIRLYANPLSSNPKLPKRAGPLPSRRRYSCLRSKLARRQLMRTSISRRPTHCILDGSAPKMVSASESRRNGSERRLDACSEDLFPQATAASSRNWTESSQCRTLITAQSTSMMYRPERASRGLSSATHQKAVDAS